MDEHREEREELAEIERDDADDRRQQATADEHMRENALSWAEFVSMEQWRG